LAAMYKKGGDPEQIMSDLGLEQMDDEKELENVIKEVIQKNPAQAEQFKSGKVAVLQYLVGQAMSATKGKANPKKLAEIMRRLLIE